MIYILKGKWSYRYDKCKECGQTRLKHGAFGLCVSCYSKYLYHNRPEYKSYHNKYVKAWQKANPEKCREMSKKAMKKYLAKKYDNTQKPNRNIGHRLHYYSRIKHL